MLSSSSSSPPQSIKTLTFGWCHVAIKCNLRGNLMLNVGMMSDATDSDKDFAVAQSREELVVTGYPRASALNIETEPDRIHIKKLNVHHATVNFDAHGGAFIDHLMRLRDGDVMVMDITGDEDAAILNIPGCSVRACLTIKCVNPRARVSAINTRTPFRVLDLKSFTHGTLSGFHLNNDCTLLLPPQAASSSVSISMMIGAHTRVSGNLADFPGITRESPSPPTITALWGFDNTPTGVEEMSNFFARGLINGSHGRRLGGDFLHISTRSSFLVDPDEGSSSPETSQAFENRDDIRPTAAWPNTTNGPLAALGRGPLSSTTQQQMNFTMPATMRSIFEDIMMPADMSTYMPDDQVPDPVMRLNSVFDAWTTRLDILKAVKGYLRPSDIDFAAFLRANHPLLVPRVSDTIRFRRLCQHTADTPTLGTDLPPAELVVEEQDPERRCVICQDATAHFAPCEQCVSSRACEYCLTRQILTLNDTCCVCNTCKMRRPAVRMD